MRSMFFVAATSISLLCGEAAPTFNNQNVMRFDVRINEKDLYRSIVKGFKEVPSQAKVTLNQAKDRGFNWLEINKWKIISGSLIAGYGFVYCFIINKNSFLSDFKRWHCWKSELSLEDLLDIPQHNLTQQLIKDIHKRYADEFNAADFIAPFMLFSADIKNEIKELEEYLKLVVSVKAIKLDSILPALNQDLAKSKIQRLKYINSLFKSWCLEYNAQKIDRFYRRQRISRYL